MAKPPLILVAPSIEKRGVEFHDLSVSLSVKYDLAITQAGGIPVTLPTTNDRSLITECVRRVDGVLLTGGDDINPDLYTKGPAYTAKCISNQKQIALGLILWKSDHNEQFPWQLSVTNDGTSEYLATGEAIVHLCVVSNYLKNPSIFHCPTDRTRQWPATQAFPDNTNLSYFVATDVATNPASNILTGDRNLECNSKPVIPGLFIYSTTMKMNWTRELHHGQNLAYGVLSFADGHVVRPRGIDLNSVFQHEGLAINHLAVP